MRNPKAGPAAYLLLRGEGNSEDATSPARSASYLRVAVLHSASNGCSYRLDGVPMLAGIPVAAELIWDLADLVDEPAASTLRNYLKAGRTTFALTIAEREAILRALDEPPDGLAELRGVLLREHEWRVREGLV
jgi:hypothetical protein